MTAAPVVLPPLDGQQAQAWDTLMAVAADLGRGWTLIGGQMAASRTTVGCGPGRGPRDTAPVAATSSRTASNTRSGLPLARSRLRHNVSTVGPDPN